MKLRLWSCLLGIMVAGTLPTIAQENSTVNFDKINIKDFSLEGVNVDTTYGAVVLADVGKSSFITNKKGEFSLVFKYQCRIKILHQKAFDIATIKIPLYKSTKSDNEETLESLKATTYNIIDGKIVGTDLEKSNVYKEVMDKNHSLRKFTMPAIKEGSVIDISYTIQSDFIFNLQPWTFQSGYPKLWSEYNLNLPQFFEYVFLKTGPRQFDIKDTKEKFQNFIIRQPSDIPAFSSETLISLSSTNTISRWVMKNVPAIKEEPFTSSLNNHISKIEFQMSGVQWPDLKHIDIMGSWTTAGLKLMQSEDFGSSFAEENKWVTDALKTMGIEGKTSLEKAKVIYSYLQKNIGSLGSRDIYLTKPLKETFNSKKGYVPDINLLLTLCLKKAGLAAFPVLVSTRAHGYAAMQYPILSQYNYVVSKLELDGKVFYLDASKNYLGFGKIPSYCYNGPAAFIDMLPATEPLHTDSLTEKKITNVTLFNDDKTKNGWVGSFMSLLGYEESSGIRERINEKSKADYEKILSDAYSGDFSIDNIKMNDLDNTDKPITMNYSLKIERSDDNNIIYFNPMLKEGIKENYFKSSDRKYPVELTAKIDESYIFTIDIPTGYVLDEVPQSTRVSLNESEGSFEYIISKNEQSVTLNTSLKLNRTIFYDDEYESLRGFFDFVVKKHAEQIVFKKKS
ncbi:MAG: DUF3858 domain-containing protein [Chitinophagaceae bacterium]|nr:MAG: DUF3858 domain-containing protein [Chitinophagaceae bacterium]